MSTIVGYGVSDTLKSLFEGLRQTTKEDGVTPVYHDKDVRELAKHLCCRNYGFLCWELLHLYWAVVHAYPSFRGQNSWLNFFWIERPFSAKTFRSAFSQGASWQGGEVKMESEALSIVIGPAKFAISPTRISLLATFNEFLLSVDSGLIQGFQTELIHSDINKVKQLSNQLQTVLYEFLKTHIPVAQQQTRFRYFENWLKNADLSPENVNDGDIFQFWVRASEDPDAESYKRFHTAFFDVLDSLTAFKVVDSQNGAAYAQTIGGDFQKGELDAGDWQESFATDSSNEMSVSNLANLAFEDVDENFDVNSLSKTPKCLSQNEISAMLYPMTYSVYAGRFLLSFLRLYVFDKWQAVIIQAMRKSKSSVYEKLQQPPSDTYGTYLQLLDSCNESLVFSRDCLLHILLQIEPKDACSELLQGLSKSTLADIALWMHESDTQSDMNHLAKKLIMGFPEFRRAVENCEIAYRKNNKAGFKQLTEAIDPEIYLETLNKVNKTTAKLDSFRLKIKQFLIDDLSLETKFSSDVCIFTSRFNSLYGDNNAGE